MLQPTTLIIVGTLIVVVIIVFYFIYRDASKEGYMADKRSAWFRRPMSANVIPFKYGCTTLIGCRSPMDYVDKYGYVWNYPNLEDISNIRWLK